MESRDAINPATVSVSQQPPDRTTFRSSLRQERNIEANIASHLGIAPEIEKGPGHRSRDHISGYKITIYPSYFLSLVGFLKVVQVIVAIIVCATTDASQCISGILCSAPSGPLWYGVLSGGEGFILAAGILIILGNLSFIAYHILIKSPPASKLADRVRIGELVYTITAMILFMAVGCVQAWYASWMTLQIPDTKGVQITDQIIWNPYRPQWIAASVFAWINVLLFAGDAVCIFFFADEATRTGTFSKRVTSN